jgi:branched-chain amino acid transport system substrate-binding protein
MRRLGSSRRTSDPGGFVEHATKRSIGAVVVVILGVLALGVGSAGAASGTNDPGVTDKAINVGYIYSGTGAAGSTFKNAGDACQARVDRENRNGGVNGRKINLIAIDDKSGGDNLTATKDLIQNRDAFVIVNNSSFAFLSYRTMLENKVPMIGGGYDGGYYGQPGNESLFSALDAPFDDLTSDGTARLLKQLGAKKIGTVGYGASASSTASAKLTQQYAVPDQGLEAVYTNTTVDFGSTDVGPLILGFKNAGVDGAYLPLVASTDFAILSGLSQNGVTMKGVVLPTGYGQDLLDSPTSKTLGSSVVFTNIWQPVELKTKATKQFQADLKKQSGFTGVPDYGQYTGYITCELAILGLRNAGKTPTRDGFVTGLRTLGSYDAAGMGCMPTDISAEHYGKFPLEGCTYAVTVKDGKFVPLNKGKLIPTKLVGDPATVAAKTYSTKDSSSTTTTAK